MLPRKGLTRFLAANSSCQLANGLVCYKPMPDEPQPSSPLSPFTTLPGESPSASLQQQIRQGTRSVLVGQLLGQLASLVTLGLLYRLVKPEEYGLLSLLLPLVMLPRMAATLGLGGAIVQGESLSPGQLNALFWTQLRWGVLAALVTMLGSPVLAQLWGVPQLLPLGIALGLTTLVAALANQHLMLLEKKLQMAAAARARWVAQAVGGIIGVLIAWRGGGVWSLVAQQAAELIVLCGLAWRLEPWRPTARQGSTEPIQSLLFFGGHFSASQLVAYLGQNLHSVLFPLLIGSVAATAPLGLYSQSQALLLRIVFLITVPIGSIMFAALAQARNNPVLFSELTAKFYRLTAVLLFPCGVGLWAVAPDVMGVLGGPKWQGAGPILAAFAPAIIAQGLINLSFSLLGAKGLGKTLFAATLLVTLVVAQGLLAGYFIPRIMLDQTVFSPLEVAQGMAWGYSLATIVVVLVPYLVFCLIAAEVSPAQVLLPLVRPLLAALLMGLVAWSLRKVLLASVPWLAEIEAVRLALLVVAGSLIYLLVGWREIVWAWGELRTETGSGQGR